MECLWHSLEKRHLIWLPCAFRKKRWDGREWESLTVLEKYPKLKQINASLWALENNGIGLIQGIELRKVAYQKDKLWPRVEQYPLLRGNTISYKELGKSEII